MNKVLLTTSILSILYSTTALSNTTVATSANESIEIQDTGLYSDRNPDKNIVKVSANGNVVIGSLNGHAAIYNQNDLSLVDLGTLKADNSGGSGAIAVSANGKVITGSAENDNNDYHAFRYSDGKMISLGTLQTDNSGYSVATGISTNGRVIIGYSSNDKGNYRAFRHNEGDAKITDLGTFKDDNSGWSTANAISADGRVIVGNAAGSNEAFHAFRHNEGDAKITDLGTLKADNTGSSNASAVSADGKIVVGQAASGNGYHAFRHNEGDVKMTDLGTLKADNSGDSAAIAVSNNGKVTVGSANNDNGVSHAFRHNEGDAKMTDLGTLKADHSGYSEALAISADGKIVVGHADNDNGDVHAFRHNEGDATMTDLGTLKADNSGNSAATSISADGKVIAGWSDNDLGQQKIVLWKSSKAVDLEKTIESMKDSAHKAQQILGLYEGQLSSLADSRCQLGESNYCIGAYTNYNNVRNSDLLATGIFGAVRISNTGWTIGGSANVNAHADLVRGYKTSGTNLPGIGAFIRHESHKDGTGLVSELSGSYLKQDLQITRQAQEGAERGYGETKLQGYLVDLGFGYGIKTSENSLVTPKVSVRHHDISRDAYTETQDADFLASYSKMENKSTELKLAVNTQYQFSPKVSLDAEVGTYATLSHSRNDATVSIDYVGDYKDEKATQNNSFKPFVRFGVNYGVTPRSILGLNAGWSKTSYDDNFAQASVAYSYHW